MIIDKYNFKKLRDEVNKKSEKDLKLRIKINPIPTNEEIYIGAFKEELEPQVADAIFKIFQKGYSTVSSGFYGDEGEIQAIDGYFNIDDKTREKLYKIDVTVYKGIHLGMPGESKYWTSIRFWPNIADLKLIKNKWGQIIKILPDLHHHAPPSISGGAQYFREKYVKDRIDVEKEFLKQILKVQELHPDYKKKYQKRLAEINKIH